MEYKNILRTGLCCRDGKTRLRELDLKGVDLGVMAKEVEEVFCQGERKNEAAAAEQLVNINIFTNRWIFNPRCLRPPLREKSCVTLEVKGYFWEEVEVVTFKRLEVIFRQFKVILKRSHLTLQRSKVTFLGHESNVMGTRFNFKTSNSCNSCSCSLCLLI